MLETQNTTETATPVRSLKAATGDPNSEKGDYGFNTGNGDPVLHDVKVPYVPSHGTPRGASRAGEGLYTTF